GKGRARKTGGQVDRGCIRAGGGGAGTALPHPCSRSDSSVDLLRRTDGAARHATAAWKTEAQGGAGDAVTASAMRTAGQRRYNMHDRPARSTNWAPATGRDLACPP